MQNIINHYYRIPFGFFFGIVRINGIEILNLIDVKSTRISATVELVCLVNGQLAPSPEYDEAFKDYI